MKLVIAEKPSVALSLAKVLGATKKHDGYLAGGGYLVSWCYGHLLKLAEPTQYDESLKKWTYETLPIMPDVWKYSVSADKKKQLAVLCTEDSLLAAMETAGAEETPDEAERKGLGTPATRAAILEKLVVTGFVERNKKLLLPTQKGVDLITVLPDNIKSPLLTAEWESQLLQIERGELSAVSFMNGIKEMVRELVRTHNQPERKFLSMFPNKNDDREVIGVCPRCGSAVKESQKGFFCDNRSCSFALWKENRFFASKKKILTKYIAAALLKEGRVFVKDLYSEKKNKTYGAVVVLDDTGGKYVNFKLEFPQGKGGRK